MRRILWITMCFTIALLSSPLLATATSNKPSPSVQKQVGMITVQFDVIRVVNPTPITNTAYPPSSRAYLPSCPPGSTYVSGVKASWQELDQEPNFPYCNCICNGICNGLSGLSSTGGRTPLYTARVTCAVTVQGWFDTSLVTKGNLSAVPRQFYYCQAGACTTKPLPANLNYSVPLGGFANTSKIDFEACPIAFTKGCLGPDQSSISRPAIALP